jgi:hypothetical protein
VNPPGYPEVQTGGVVDQIIQTRYNDSGAAMPRDLLVRQESWAFASPPYDDFIIIRYHMHNQGVSTLSDLYAGVFLDLDLGSSPWDDQGSVAEAQRIVYMHDPSGLHVGLAYLTSPDMIGLANLTLVHNPTFVHPQNYVLDSDKTAFLQAADPAHVLTDGSTPDEYSLLASAGPFSLAPQDSSEVIFALVGGSSLGELQDHADAARQILSEIITGVSDTVQPQPVTTRLLANAPNPFNPATVIRFQLGQPERVRLAIYDLTGRLVKMLVDEPRDSGLHSVSWNGCDEKGRRLASGVYFCRLEAGATVESRRLLMVK